MLDSIYVNSRLLRAVMVSRSRSAPDSAGGSIDKCRHDLDMLLTGINCVWVSCGSDIVNGSVLNYNFIIHAICEWHVSKLERITKEIIN